MNVPNEHIIRECLAIEAFWFSPGWQYYGRPPVDGSTCSWSAFTETAEGPHVIRLKGF
jgi:hypothetical protein